MRKKKLRYFTPGHETPLCGHATIGAVFFMCEGLGNTEFTIETKAGILSIHYDDTEKLVTMQQASPTFLSFEGSLERLCESIGITTGDLHATLPVVYGSTGSWKLLVPVKTPAVLDGMIPKTNLFPNVLFENRRASIHPFVFFHDNPTCLYGRHFSSPFSGTIEDSVTGTASGVMGAYMSDHLYLEKQEKIFSVHQGKHMGNEGEVQVRVYTNHFHQKNVEISGTACFNSVIQVD